MWTEVESDGETCRYLSDTDNSTLWLNALKKKLGRLAMQLTGFVCNTLRLHASSLHLHRADQVQVSLITVLCKSGICNFITLKVIFKLV